MLTYILLIQGLVRPILASSVFQPNCTIPPESTNFVRATNVRGTLDILWTSLFTLITCCWTVQHLNIPRQLQRPRWPEERNINVWRESVRYAYQLMRFYFLGVWPKIKWTLLTLVIPEFLVGKALQERYLAKKSVREFKHLAQELGEEFRWIEKHWTMTHGFYANMGGFVLRVKCNGELQDIPLNCMSLQEICRAHTDNPYLSIGVVTIPEITDEEINDKSKSDFLIKVITIGQLLWFVVQAAVRAARGLVVSQLEVVVLAYAACTVFVFLLCLSKPKDVRVPTILLTKGPTNPDDSAEAKEPTGIRESSPFQGHAIHSLSEEKRDQILALRRLTSWFETQRPFVTHDDVWYGKELGLGPLPNDGVLPYKEVDNHMKIGNYLFTHIDIGFLIAGTVFGGIHCAAWASHFPTPIERLLWQVSSGCTAGLLPVLTFCKMGKNTSVPGSLYFILEALEISLLLAYLLARLYLVVEVFRALCFLPSSAFVATWTAEIPHIA
ncbi:hypothetical protein M434DRAFT_33049 [Hypoxylon sp. CO27-5]|nr:hypothetical protein M434DRAFT_33049 [Hypoxylon sp. CO27-5]